jgi:hypothetical protein
MSQRQKNAVTHTKKTLLLRTSKSFCQKPLEDFLYFKKKPRLLVSTHRRNEASAAQALPAASFQRLCRSHALKKRQ